MHNHVISAAFIKVTLFCVCFIFLKFKREFQRMKPPYTQGKIDEKVTEFMPTLLAISKGKGDIERFCRTAATVELNPEVALSEYYKRIIF